MSGDFRRYRILGCLGRGGLGEVYLAEELPRGQKYALKFPLQRADLDWFWKEAHVLQDLKHPNIVDLRDFVRIDGEPVIVMEFVDGVNLAHFRSPREALPHGPALEIVAGVARALSYAWSTEKKIVHRDVSFMNVMITRFGVVKLMDFGIARVDHADPVFAPTLGPGSGQNHFRSPEGWRGERAGPEADIYALGIVLFEVLFHEDLGLEVPARGTREEYELKLKGRLAAFREGAGSEGAREPIARLLERMLGFDPAARPGAEEVAREAGRIARAMGDEPLADWAARRLAGYQAPIRRDGRAGEHDAEVVPPVEFTTQGGKAQPARSPPPGAPRSLPPQTPRPGGELVVEVEDLHSPLSAPAGRPEPARAASRGWWWKLGLPLAAASAVIAGVALTLGGDPTPAPGAPAQVASVASAPPPVALPARLSVGTPGLALEVRGADGEIHALSAGAPTEVPAGEYELEGSGAGRVATGRFEAVAGRDHTLYCDLDDGVCAADSAPPWRGAVRLAGRGAATAAAVTGADGRSTAVPTDGAALRLAPGSYRWMAKTSGGIAMLDLTVKAGETLSVHCAAKCSRCALDAAPSCANPGREVGRESGVADTPPPERTTASVAFAGADVSGVTLIDSAQEDHALPQSALQPGTYRIRLKDTENNRKVISRSIHLEARSYTLTCSFRDQTCAW